MRAVTLVEARHIAMSVLERNEVARRPAQADGPEMCECDHIVARHADGTGPCDYVDHIGWCTCTAFVPERDV